MIWVGPERAGLVAHARETIARGSQSFAAASRLFDRATRERAWLLYGWCRRCDDLADGQDLGHDMASPEDPRARLATIRERTAAALSGKATGDPAFDGLAIVAAECAIPRAMIEDHIAGFALDAEGWIPKSEDDLYRYCHHVAGVVGQMMALVMGVSSEDEFAMECAERMGSGFQFANIARDIIEDARNSRCYLPKAWLVEKDIDPEALAAPEYRQSLGDLQYRLTVLALENVWEGRFGTPALSFRSAWAVLSAAGIYGDIAVQIRQAGVGALDRRIHTSRQQKIGWIVRAGWQAARRRKLFGARN